MTKTLLDQLKSSISGPLTGTAASTLGETPANVEIALNAAIPTILSSMAAATLLPSGLSIVHRLVADPANDGTLLHQLPALYQGTMTPTPIYRLGSQLLSGIFGSKLSQVTHSIASLASIKPSASSQLLNTLAPHILSVLGERYRTTQDPSPAALAKLLETENATISYAVPPSVLHIFKAPPATRVATAVPAAQAAAMAHSTRLAAQTGAASSSAKPAAALSRGTGPWLIFPAGLVIGLAMLGLGGIIDQRPDEPSRVALSLPPPPAGLPPAPKPALSVPPSEPVAKAAEPAKPASAAPAKPPAQPKTAPAAVKPVAVAPAKAVEPPRPTVPGVTTFFGAGPTPPEAPARANPDYKPLTPVVEQSAAAAIPPADVAGMIKPADAQPSAPAGPSVSAAAPPASAVQPPAAPVKPLPPPRPAGVTTYFGSPPATTEAPARANPDYKPVPGQVAFLAKPAPAPTPNAPALTSPAAPAATPPSAVSPASLGLEPCRAALADAAKRGPVLFEVAKADLKRTSTATLDQIATVFKSCEKVRLNVEGHTDSMGKAEMNQKLSQARARTVVEYLMSKGIDAQRLSGQGYGLTRPLVPNTSARNMALNRRIDFVVDPL